MVSFTVLVFKTWSIKKILRISSNLEFFDVFVFEDERTYSLSLEDLAFLFTDMTVPRLTEVKTLRRMAKF